MRLFDRIHIFPYSQVFDSSKFNSNMFQHVPMLSGMADMKSSSSVDLPNLPSQRNPSSASQLQPESLSDEELSNWMQFFGLKPSSSREFMIRKLHDIVDYMDGGTAWLQSIREAPTPQARTTKTKRKKQTEKSETKSPKMTQSKKASPKPKAKDRNAKAAPEIAASMATSPSTANSASPDEKWEKKLQLAADAIREDKDLYAKLLTFEPLEVREVKRRIVQMKPELKSLGEQRLRKYLDEQGFASVS